METGSPWNGCIAIRCAVACSAAALGSLSAMFESARPSCHTVTYLPHRGLQLLLSVRAGRGCCLCQRLLGRGALRRKLRLRGAAHARKLVGRGACARLCLRCHPPRCGSGV